MAITSGADLSVIEGRLTAARAGYIDNLSAGAVAQAGVFTATRAGYLDNLSAGAAALQSTAAAIPTTPIKSIQYLNTNIPIGSSSKATTINAIVIAKSIIIGQFNNSTLAAPLNADDYVGFDFTSTTVVTGVSEANAAGANTQFKCYIVEYN